MEAKAMVPRVAIGYGCAGVAELLACLVVFSSATGAQTLMPASGPGGLVRLFTSDAAMLEAQETRKDIPCTATPVKPALGFDLKFHAGYDVTVPLKDLATCRICRASVARTPPLKTKDALASNRSSSTSATSAGLPSQRR